MNVTYNFPEFIHELFSAPDDLLSGLNKLHVPDGQRIGKTWPVDHVF